MAPRRKARDRLGASAHVEPESSTSEHVQQKRAVTIIENHYSHYAIAPDELVK